MEVIKVTNKFLNISWLQIKIYGKFEEPMRFWFVIMYSEIIPKLLISGAWQQELKEALDQLTELLCGEELLSAYELQSSGLAPALLEVLSSQSSGTEDIS